MINTDPEKQIDKLKKRAEDSTKVPDQEKRRGITLYCEGLRSRLRNADYALVQLRHYTAVLPADVSTKEPSLEDRIVFYSDSFWAYMRAALDVLGQLTNQIESLGIPENEAYFWGVYEALKKAKPKHKVAQALEALVKSRHFKPLNDYRRCCLHRRHVYVEKHEVTGARGYHRADSTTTTTTAEIPRYVWWICDDPLLIKVTTKKQREIPTYLEECRANVGNKLARVLAQLMS